MGGYQSEAKAINVMSMCITEFNDSRTYILLFQSYDVFREIEMRNVNEKTNTLIARFGIASLLVCLSAAVWQIWHIQSFFKNKKLI